MTVLIINPVCGHRCDEREALWYIEPYWKQIKETLDKANIENIYRYKEEAKKNYIWNDHAFQKPKIIIGAGHGNVNVFTGYKLNLIYYVNMHEDDFPIDSIKNAIFLMLSCLTAKELGPYIVHRLKAKAYLGWEKEYTFVVKWGKRKGSNWKESPDLLFLKPIEEAFVKVGLGEFTPEEAYNYIKLKYEEILQNSEVPNDIKQWIKWNLKHMKLITMEMPEPVIVDVGLEIPIENGYTQYWYSPFEVNVNEEFTKEFKIPESKDYIEGEGKVIIKAKLKYNPEVKTETKVKVMFKKVKKELKIEVKEPKQGQTLVYGEKFTLKAIVKYE